MLSARRVVRLGQLFELVAPGVVGGLGDRDGLGAADEDLLRLDQVETGELLDDRARDPVAGARVAQSMRVDRAGVQPCHLPVALEEVSAGVVGDDVRQPGVDPRAVMPDQRPGFQDVAEQALGDVDAILDQLDGVQGVEQLEVPAGTHVEADGRQLVVRVLQVLDLRQRRVQLEQVDQEVDLPDELSLARPTPVALDLALAPREVHFTAPNERGMKTY